MLNNNPLKISYELPSTMLINLQKFINYHNT